MAKGFRRLFQAIDYGEVVREYPPPPEYFELDFFLEPEQIERRQFQRLREEVWRAYGVPFYRRRWDEVGFHPSQLRTLSDMHRIPIYNIDHIRESLAAHPPYGDYQGVAISDALDQPLRIYWSGGTTGRPRPTVYTQWDREIASITVARALYLHGVRPGDVVVNAWAFSTHAGAWAFDEGLHHWLNCVDITTGTGNVTPTKMQLQLAREYEAATILTTPDYLLHLAQVAKEMGLDPRSDFSIRTLPTPGQNPKVAETWGVPTWDSYGTHEVQYVSAECPARGGLHIFEDCFVVEIADVATGELLPDGEEGNIVYTCLYKTGSPQVRFNTQDRSTLYPRRQCECGSWLRKMGYFAGRSDTMVKLRGINIYPEEIGKALASDSRVEDDYFVTVRREANRDDIVVQVVSGIETSGHSELAESLSAQLRERFELRIGVEIVAPGALDELTGKGAVGKLRRFKDARVQDPA
jgi:phenylacetate-CoA ligase